MSERFVRKEIVIVGFPKCGTSALFRALEQNEKVHALRAPNGHIELPWPAIRSVTGQTPSGKVRLHKLPGYIFNAKAMDYLAQSNPDSILVLCIRDPQKALVSWWNMHQKIARSETPSDHFAYLEREFFATCDVNAYYQRYAKERLQYGKYAENLIQRVGRKRVAVIAQERMARGLDPIVEFLLKIADGQTPDALSETSAEKLHHGFADTVAIKVDDAHARELDKTKLDLYRTVANCRAFSLL